MSIDTENTSPRLGIAALFLSAAGLVSIALNEGYSDKAIIPVSGDVPTIGFGTTEGVKLGDRITPPKALARALNDVEKFEGALKKCIKVPLHQHEYDAYVDLSYNIGSGAFCGSTLVKKVNAYDYTGACNAILNWRYYQGSDCSLPANKALCGGLWVRRLRTTSLCLGLSQ
jgi:lysozyme